MPGAALALRSLCDGHHKKALFIAELRKKNCESLTTPALAGISSDLMQSREAMDHCRRRPIGLCADAQIRDDGPNWRRIMKALIAALALATLIAAPTFAQPANAAPMSPASSSFGSNGY